MSCLLLLLAGRQRRLQLFAPRPNFSLLVDSELFPGTYQIRRAGLCCFSPYLFYFSERRNRSGIRSGRRPAACGNIIFCSQRAFLVPFAAPRTPMPSGSRLDETFRVDLTLTHALAQRFVKLISEMLGREQAAARAAFLSAI